MKRKIIETPGDIVYIPLPNGMHTYARILIDTSYAFYDAKTNEDISDLEEVIKRPILFVAKVDIFGLKEGWWKILGNITLKDNLQYYRPSYFNPAPTNSDDVNFYNLHKNEIEEAIKKDWISDGTLQLGGIHGRVHIESRIMDYYEGRRHSHNKNAMWVFKKYHGLPLDNL